MGGCASKPKEFDTTKPEALPSESASPKKADQEGGETSTTTPANPEGSNTNAANGGADETQTNEPPLVDLSKPEEEGEISSSNAAVSEAAPAVVLPLEVPAAAAPAEVLVTDQKPKEEAAVLVIDQPEVSAIAKQLAQIDIVEAVKDTKEKEAAAETEIKPKAKEEEPAAEIKPKAKEEDLQDKPIKAAAAPNSEDKTATTV